MVFFEKRANVFHALENRISMLIRFIGLCNRWDDDLFWSKKSEAYLCFYEKNYEQADR
ncbi:hypothetical protein D2M30_0542 [Bacillus amyloliquefaciens]|nr:hypothetical protein D2M30_0542 [Bacillus amyloliquefaciens]